MKNKGKFWLRLAVVSVLFGMALAISLLCADPKNCTLSYFLWLGAILVAVCFGGATFLLFLRWWLALLFRWLFTWRILKRCLPVFLFFVALVPLFYAEENWRGHRAWENYKHELETKGEKLDFASFIPSPVPDEQNFAFAPVVRTSWNWLLDTNGRILSEQNTNIIHRLEVTIERTNHLVSALPEMTEADWRMGTSVDLAAWQKYYRTAFLTNTYRVEYRHQMPDENNPSVVTNYPNPADTNEMIEIMALATDEFPIGLQLQTPPADVLLALGKHDGVLEELSEAAKRPQSRFPLNYDADNQLSILIPHYSGLKDCVHALSLRASAGLSAKNPTQALADIKLILRLMDSIHAEPVELAENSRLDWFRSALQPVWEGWSGNGWTEAQLIELDAALSQLDFVTDYANTVRARSAEDIAVVEYCRLRGNKKVFSYLCGDCEFNFDLWLHETWYRLFPDGWFAQGKLTICQAWYEGQLPVVDLTGKTFSPKKYSDASGRMFAKIDGRFSAPWNIWARMLISDAKPKRFAEAQAWCNLARVVIALERHRLAEGTYPVSLDALAPRFMERVPRDVINGQPLHYRRTADGKFLLYSIGWDEVDDGGVIFKTEQGRLDQKKGTGFGCFRPAETASDLLCPCDG